MASQADDDDDGAQGGGRQTAAHLRAELAAEGGADGDQADGGPVEVRRRRGRRRAATPLTIAARTFLRALMRCRSSLSSRPIRER